MTLVCSRCNRAMTWHQEARVWQCVCGRVVNEYTTERSVVADAVNHPPHYAQLAPHEPIDVIEHWGLGYFLGNVVKYVARAGRKGSALDDLRKARVYLDREIQRREREAGGG